MAPIKISKVEDARDKIFEVLVLVTALLLTFFSLFANPICRLMVDSEKGCGASLDDAMDYTLAHTHFNNETAKVVWHNPGYIADTERLVRRWFLLGMNLIEADLGRRMAIAVFSGAMIGFERRSADRPAGIRTMSLASLGACLFTICGTWAFTNGWNNWDASRVSAAIPSGVGFLGSGIVWKGQTDEGRHAVRGLTTAAGVWISAATGLAAGGGLYVPSIFGSLLSVLVLRYGPRLYGHPDYTDNQEEEGDNDTDDGCPAEAADQVLPLQSTTSPRTSESVREFRIGSLDDERVVDEEGPQNSRSASIDLENLRDASLSQGGGSSSEPLLASAERTRSFATFSQSHNSIHRTASIRLRRSNQSVLDPEI